ncbi:hypothetical protein DFJ73DRAFT_777385 [Zopfochytrium polystomum]|nr:hypothetical protein DFJ73DRAFT_777385 [Zopfochytrium polystomum]
MSSSSYHHHGRDCVHLHSKDHPLLEWALLPGFKAAVAREESCSTTASPDIAVGRFLVASEDCERLAPVLRVRAERLLSADAADACIRPLLQFAWDRTSFDEELALVLLLIWSKHTASSPFRQYVEELPSNFAHIPLHMLAAEPDRAEALFCSTPLLGVLHGQLANLRLLFEDVIKPAVDAFPIYFGVADGSVATELTGNDTSSLDERIWADLLWAYLAVESRAFRIAKDVTSLVADPSHTVSQTDPACPTPPAAAAAPQLQTILVPAGDMANHRPSEEANLMTMGLERGTGGKGNGSASSGSDEGGAYLLIAAATPIRAGEELTLCYRDHLPNWMLLYHYGFCFADNPSDSVVFSFEPDEFEGVEGDHGDDETDAKRSASGQQDGCKDRIRAGDVESDWGGGEGAGGPSGEDRYVGELGVMKEIIAGACGLEPEFEVGYKTGCRVPEEALAFLRLSLATRADLSGITVGNANQRLFRPLSDKNERAVVDFVRRTARALMRRHEEVLRSVVFREEERYVALFLQGQVKMLSTMLSLL